MFFNLALLTLLGSVSALKINTPPALIECQPVQLAWAEGTGPYYPAVIPGGQASAEALKTFDKTDASSLTWTVDLAAGTDVTIRIMDGTGASAFTSQLIVQKGSDQSCLTGGSGSSAAAGSSDTSAAGSSDASAAAAAPSAAAASSPASGSSSSGSGAVQAGAAAASAAASGATTAAGTAAAAGTSAATAATKPSAAGASAAASATPASGAGRVGAGIAAVAGAAIFAMAF